MTNVIKEKPKYQFFSEADVDPVTGSIKSEYPMWYNQRLIEDFEDEVAHRQAALEANQVPEGVRSDFAHNLARMKEQLEKMKDMTMVDDARNDRDSLGKAVKEMAKIIKDELPSRTLCDRGHVDSNIEYHRMTKPYITIQNDNLAALAEACNVPIVDGKVTREGMSKMWKVATRYLGDYANTDTLRKL